MKKITHQSSVWLLTLLLTGCGGGGDVDAIATTGVSITHFLGRWQNINPYPVCELDPQLNVYLSEGTTTLKGLTYQESYDYYEDENCANYLGSSHSSFDIEWTVPTSPNTKTGGIRARISHPRYSASGEIRPPTVTSDPTISYKVLFHVENNTLSSYFDVVSPDLDTEGYPLGTSPPLFTYRR